MKCDDFGAGRLVYLHHVGNGISEWVTVVSPRVPSSWTGGPPNVRVRRSNGEERDVAPSVLFPTDAAHAAGARDVRDRRVSARALNRLESVGLTLEQARGLSDDELRMIDGIGPTLIRWIRGDTESPQSQDGPTPLFGARIRRLADALPPGASVSLTREALLSLLAPDEVPSL